MHAALEEASPDGVKPWRRLAQMECSGRRSLVERKRKDLGHCSCRGGHQRVLWDPGGFSQGVSVVVMTLRMVHKECGVQNAHLGVSMDSGVAANLHE